MRAQIKVVLLVVAVVFVTVAALVWKTQNLLVEDQRSFVNDSAMKQLAPLKRLVADRLENEKNDLVRFATSREASGPGHATAFGAFDAIAFIEPSPTNGQWGPTWIEKGPSLRAERWPQGYDLTLLKSLPYARVKDGSSLWVRLSDAQGGALYAILNSVEVQPLAVPQAPAQALPSQVPQVAAPVGTSTTAAATTAATAGSPARRAIVVGFASENPLASVTEDYIGSTNSVYIVDDRGYVASHTKTSYVGSSFGEDKMTQEITKSPKIADTRETTDIDGAKVVGHFEKIDHTNLAAVILTPLTATTGLASQFTSSALMVGAIIGLFALLAAYMIGSTLQSPPAAGSGFAATPALDVDEPDSFVAVETRNLPHEVPREELAQEPAVVQDDRLRTERKNAFEAFNAGLAARLREPLLAILGHAQLLKTKSQDEALQAHADSIEREARLAKEAIERFQVIEETASLGLVNEKCDLEKAVLAALAEKAIEIEGSGITLEQHLTHTPRIKGRSADLEAAVVHILENAIEAVKDRPIKKITVALSWLNDRVRLLISDSGIGMTRDTASRAFEPFYKGFEAPRHMGLGLAFVQTTLKRVGATHELETSPGEGTVFTIEFPVDAEARREFEKATAAPSLDQINDSIEAFTLGGRKPLTGSVNAPKAPPSGPPSAPPSPMMANAGAAARGSDAGASEPALGTINEFTISSITNPSITEPPPTNDNGGFQVKIRRPKPRG